MAIFLGLGSCAGPVMTKHDFNAIAIGAQSQNVLERAGDPYEIEHLENGMEVYRYIERIQTSPNSTAQNTYILYIAHGRVVYKEIQESGSTIEIRSP